MLGLGLQWFEAGDWGDVEEEGRGEECGRWFSCQNRKSGEEKEGTR